MMDWNDDAYVLGLNEAQEDAYLDALSAAAAYAAADNPPVACMNCGELIGYEHGPGTYECPECGEVYYVTHLAFQGVWVGMAILSRSDLGVNVTVRQ